jgi:23S rRNA pseudouridine2605 synthase
MAERINKWLASMGAGSRREVERWITEGRLKVNNKPAELGQMVEPTDKFSLDGRTLRVSSEKPGATRVLMYYKPEGEVVSRNDEKGRDNVFQNLPPLRAGRWIAVGRLDINTSGLLLFTNNGELAQKLMHPSSQIVRRYATRVFGNVAADVMETLRKGVKLEDGEASFDDVRPLRFALDTDDMLEDNPEGRDRNRWFECTLREGRNREVRRLWESQGFVVSRLIRTTYGPVSLPRQMSRSQFVDLDRGHVNQLMQSVALEPEQAQQWYDSPEQRIKAPTTRLTERRQRRAAGTSKQRAIKPAAKRTVTRKGRS